MKQFLIRESHDLDQCPRLGSNILLCLFSMIFNLAWPSCFLCISVRNHSQKFQRIKIQRLT
jgi:hypothetical protein